jgi:hypothetical protein
VRNRTGGIAAVAARQADADLWRHGGSVNRRYLTISKEQSTIRYQLLIWFSDIYTQGLGTALL